MNSHNLPKKAATGFSHDAIGFSAENPTGDLYVVF
jgi:hypothetical protein